MVRPDWEHENPDDVEPPVAPLTIDEFSIINMRRCRRWHPGFPDADSWTLADWSNALAGEGGELSDAIMDLVLSILAVNGSLGQLGNTIKKIRRIDTTHFSHREDEQDRAALVVKALGEAGDVYAYLDLLVTKIGGKLSEAASDKFNAISEREGYPERMPACSS